MLFIKKYWSIIAIVVAFLIGMFLSGGGGKDAERIAEKKIKQHETEIAQLNKKLKQSDKDRATIEAKAYQDSVKLSSDLAASNARILKYQKHVNAINLSRANTGTLDSLVSSLYPE